MNAALPDII